jgi:phosphatidylserine synthase
MSSLAGRKADYYFLPVPFSMLFILLFITFMHTWLRSPKIYVLAFNFALTCKFLKTLKILQIGKKYFFLTELVNIAKIIAVITNINSGQTEIVCKLSIELSKHAHLFQNTCACTHKRECKVHMNLRIACCF